jgi:tRNA nucleotidyltransferase (CCA-adding enzyme)
MDLLDKQIGELTEQKMEAETILHKLARDEKRTNSMLYHIMAPAATETLLFVMAKGTKEDIRKAVSLYLSTLQRVRIELGGTDLIQMGFEPGPIFSEILGAVLDARLDGKVTNKEQERAFVLGKFNPEN